MKGKKRLEYAAAMLLMAALLLCAGCNQESAAAEIAETVGAESKDRAVNQFPVAGTDNLYELRIPELTREGTVILDACSYNEYMLVFVEDMENAKYCLYKVDPLKAKISAAYEITDGYFPDADIISVNDAGDIIVKAKETGNIYFLDSELCAKKKIDIGASYCDELFLSQDSRYVYYVDDLDGGKTYQYNTENGTRTEILTDITLSRDGAVGIVGLVNNDACIMFTYGNGEESSNYYEVRNLATGEIVYSSNGSHTLWGFNENGENYSLVYCNNGWDEILFGSTDENNAMLLTFADHEEYRSYHLDVRTMTAVTARYGENRGEIVLSQYDLHSGRKEKAATVCGLDLTGTSIGSPVYMEAIDCCVCYVNGSEPLWLVWDLTAESSEASDNRVYTRSWNEAKEPSAERIAELQARAQRMSEEYGVIILFGNEVKSRSDNIYEFRVCCDMLQIGHTLDVLDKVLSRYPDGMLDQLDQLEYPSEPDYPVTKLHIYCVDEMIAVEEGTEGSGGTQDIIDGHNYIAVDICDGYTMEAVFYHEINHAIDSYIVMKDGFDRVEIPWEGLNPEGFSYDYDPFFNWFCEDYSFTANSGEGEAYFVDTYSKLNPLEDRARIAENAMLGENDPRRDLISDEPIRKKLRWICALYRANFDTTGWPEQTVWEKACGYIHGEAADGT